MKGYIYITGSGTDPGARDNLNDPLFGKVPTLGACMPNIRRLVVRGDYIFVVSGKVPGIQQYVVGGMRVAEKIEALAARERFPENRLRTDANGILRGNVIVDAKGHQDRLDNHPVATFADRVKNFVVGSDPVTLESAREVELGRARTLTMLSRLIGKPGNRPIDIVSRWSRLEERQIQDLLGWFQEIKRDAAKP